MSDIHSQAKILAQVVWEIRQLLSGYLGSLNDGDPLVRQAAHLSYALHNEALSIIEGKTFEPGVALKKIRAVDKMFGEGFTARFEGHIPSDR